MARRKPLTVENSYGKFVNSKRNYYRTLNRPMVYIVAHRFYQKQICRALENDFGFTTNGTISRSYWGTRGIQFVRSYRAGLKEWFAEMSRTRLGAVFIVCGRRVHRPAIYIDRNRHLVLLVPEITNKTWPHKSIFKQAAEYLNIDKDRFRPY